MKRCYRCQSDEETDSRFCSKCGSKFPVSVFKSLPVWIWLLIGLGTAAFGGLVIAEAVKQSREEKQTAAVTQKKDDIFAEADKKRDENIKQAKAALADGYDEKNNKFGRLDDAEKLVSDIRLYDKQYADAQDILKEVKRRREIVAVSVSPAPQKETIVSSSPKSKSAGNSFGINSPRTSSSRHSGYYVGPRGGCYTYSVSGKKRYVDHSYCN
jgi:hypothetical protein